MNIKPELKYTKDHEWLRLEGDIAFIGLADYAQEHLGDIVFVDLPQVGDGISAGEVLGVVESVKAASDVYCPVDGEIVAINEELADNPAAINEDAYAAWIAQVKITNLTQVESMLDADAYEPFCQE
ncbi:MAG: glycine cleavage system protein GcvH [Clostridiales bacterium]|jgi:glycine cleavage system H protein|nr:glycine cleavage system protein GcvH [Clostridiales bacterium]MDR2712377.1 glycine cleavage system protein GcvH [Clostridiales bacterium]